MGVLKIIRNTDSGLYYMYNALGYVTDGHTDYDKRYSINTDLDYACEQFFAVKKYFDKTSGNPVFHFIVSYNARTTFGTDYERAESLSRSIALYFADRYQIVWGIHDNRTSEKHNDRASIFHTHFVMNSVSYVDGKMFSGNHSEIFTFLEHIKKVTRDNSWILKYGSDNEYED